MSNLLLVLMWVTVLLLESMKAGASSTNYFKVAVNSAKLEGIVDAKFKDKRDTGILSGRTFPKHRIRETAQDYSANLSDLSFIMGFTAEMNLNSRVREKWNGNPATLRQTYRGFAFELKQNIGAKIQSVLFKNQTFKSLGVAPKVQIVTSLNALTNNYLDVTLKKSDSLSDVALITFLKSDFSIRVDVLAMGLKNIVKKGEALILVKIPQAKTSQSTESDIFHADLETSFFPGADDPEKTFSNEEEQVFFFHEDLSRFGSYNYTNFAGDLQHALFKAPQWWEINSDTLKTLMSTRRNEVHIVLDDLDRALPNGGAVVVKITAQDEIIVDYYTRSGSQFAQGASVYYAHQFRHFALYMGYENISRDRTGQSATENGMVGGVTISLWKGEIGRFAQIAFYAEWLIYAEVSKKLTTAADSTDPTEIESTGGTRVGIRW